MTTPNEPAPQPYPPQGYPAQPYPPQPYPPQGYPAQPYPPQPYPAQGYPPQPYPPQGYPAQPYPPQPYPPQAAPPRSKGPRPAVVVAAAAAAVAMIGGLFATCSMMFADLAESTAAVQVAVDAAMLTCAPGTGSVESCAVPAFHNALTEISASPTVGALERFIPTSREVQCNNGACKARVRGRMVFAHGEFATTLDFEEVNDTWWFVAYAPNDRGPLIRE